MSTEAIQWYDANAQRLASTYDALDSELIHRWLIDLLPSCGARVLDVGAGTGRDAAWLAGLGFEVVAVEPSDAMRQQAQGLRANANANANANAKSNAGAGVRWIADSLPDLQHVSRGDAGFELILLSAVWMHVPPAERARAFARLVELVAPAGLIAVTLRFSRVQTPHWMHPVSESELVQLARAHGADIERRLDDADAQGRPEVSWVKMAIRMP